VTATITPSRSEREREKSGFDARLVTVDNHAIARIVYMPAHVVLVDFDVVKNDET